MRLPGRRPNLLYVFADQLRLQSCGYAGDGKASTPVCAAYRASPVA